MVNNQLLTCALVLLCSCALCFPSNIEGIYEITNYYMQNKPNFQKSQMNVSIFSQKVYENISDWTLGENKPNQTQFQPQLYKTNPNRTQFQPKNEANKPNQTQFQARPLPIHSMVPKYNNFYCNQPLQAENTLIENPFSLYGRFYTSTAKKSVYNNKKQFAPRSYCDGRYCFNGSRHGLCLLGLCQRYSAA